MYWVESSYVYKASIDGSSPKRITETSSNFQRITIDHQASRLYWTKAGGIESSDLDGTNRSTVLTSPYRQIYGVAIQGDVLYWVEDNRRVKADNKLNASRPVVPLFNGTDIDDIHIISPDNQPPLTTENPCEGHPCSHICVLADVSYSYLCPSGFRLGSDDKTCKGEVINSCVCEACLL